MSASTEAAGDGSGIVNQELTPTQVGANYVLDIAIDSLYRPNENPIYLYMVNKIPNTWGDTWQYAYVPVADTGTYNLSMTANFSGQLDVYLFVVNDSIEEYDDTVSVWLDSIKIHTVEQFPAEPSDTLVTHDFTLSADNEFEPLATTIDTTALGITNIRTTGGGMAATYNTIPGRTYKLKALVSNITLTNTDASTYYLLCEGSEIDPDNTYMFGLLQEGAIDVTFTATTHTMTLAIGGDEPAPIDIEGDTPQVSFSLSRLLFIQYPVMEQVNPLLYTYRYGFNGYEKDDNIKGPGNHVSFSDYGYDPRIGRRWNVDPLSNKFSFQSPYIYAANNPIRYIDIDGENFIDASIYAILKKSKGLLVLFNESHVAAGTSGLYAYSLWQKGRIYDSKGITYFTATGTAAGFTDENNETIDVGADIDLLDFGAIYHKTGKEGVDFLNGRAPFNIDVIFLDLSFEEDMFGASLGIGKGFGINKLNYTGFSAISMTKEEQKKIQDISNWNDGVDISTLSIENRTNWTNEKGEIIGVRGEIFLTTQKFLSSKSEKKATGIFVNFMYEDTFDKENMQIWKTDNYQCEQDWGNCEDESK